jgi:hypothetical protein
MTKQFDEIVAQAEAAVANVKDAELRRVAFEKIMDALLATGRPAEGSSRRSRPSKRAGTRTASRAGKRASKSGPQAYIEELAGEGFFKKPKTISEVKAELENRGHHIPMTSLSGPLQKLCQRKTLRRQKTAGDGNKQTFNYSEW